MAGMDDDPYHVAAFVSIILICDGCNTCIDGDELVGVPHYPEPGWDEAVGDEAKRRDWKVAHSGKENPFDYSVLCRDCASNT